MVNIRGEKVVLRAVEPADEELLYQWENDVDVWGVSGTVSPFSHHTISRFIEAQREDIFSSRQMRLIICDAESGVAVGAVDLFEFEPLHQRAGVGIMIAPSFRRHGYAQDALSAIERYAIDRLRLHQLWCNIEEDNLASLSLFESLGYNQIGVKRDWNLTSTGYKAEIILQKVIA